MIRSKSSKSFVKSARILVVEDDDSTFELVKERLEGEGFQLSRAHTGFKAMNLSSESPSDLILLDYRLPDMTARQIIEFLNYNGLNIPFVIMTAHGDEELAVEMMNLGARDYIVKDERFWEVLPAKITQVLNRLQSEMKLAETEKNTKRFYAPLLFLKIMGIAFAAEVVAMLFLRLLPGLEAGLFEAVLDSSIMTIISAPFLWWYIIRPLRSVAIIENVRAASIIANAADAIIVFDERGVVESLNPAAERIFGYAAHEIVGRDIKVIMPESQSKTGEEKSASPNREVLGRRKDGGDFLMDVTVSEVLLGKYRISTAIIRDITERKRAERELQAKEEQFRSLMEASPNGIVVADKDGRVVIVNKAAEKMFGYSRKELFGNKIEMLVPVHLREGHAKHRLSYHSRPTSRSMASSGYLMARRKDGTTFPVEIALSPLKANDKYLTLSVIRDITERKRAEEQIRLQSSALQAAANAIVITDSDGVINWVNQAFTHLTGYSQDEVVGRKPSLLKSGKHDEAYFKELWETILSGNVWHGEMTNLRKDGSLYVEEQTITPVLGDDGKITNFIGIKQDITDRKRTEDAMTRFGRILESSLNEIYIFDATTLRFLQVNRGAQENLGYSMSELVHFTPLDLKPELTPDSFEKHINPLRTGDKESTLFTTIHRRKDGSTYPVEVHLQVSNLESSSVFVSIIRDITERKQAGEALIAAKARLQYLLTSSPAVIYSAEPTGGFGTTFISANIKERMGYEPQDFLDDSKFWGDHIHPEDAPHIFAELSLLFEKKHHTYEYRFQHKDGTYRWMRDELTVVRDVKGNPVEIVGYWIDITERKRAEEEFRRLHAENEQLLSAIPSILIGTDTAMCIRSWNSAAEKTFGIKPGTVAGRLLSEAEIQWDWDEINTMMAKCKKMAKPAPSRTVRYTRVDGKDGFLSISASPVIGHNKETTGYLLLGTEITERKVLENQLVQAQKLESIGQLAAGIAHEINTPIQYVGDNTRFLQEAYNDLNILLERYGTLYEAAKSQEGVFGKEILDEIATCVEDIDLEYLIDEIPTAVKQSLDGVELVAKIVRSMKEFSHPGAAEKTTADLNKAIESTITVSRNEWKYTAEIITDFDPSLPLVPCFPGELNQVILNLIINASHAIADVTKDVKGKITISTRHDGDWVEIRVGDTGSGIPAEIKSKIFDPFFTTKEIGKGTGQGLAISHNVVVEKHGGTLTCESEVGQGTTFVIRLPLMG